MVVWAAKQCFTVSIHKASAPLNFEKFRGFLKIRRIGKIWCGPTNGSQSFQKQTHDLYISYSYQGISVPIISYFVPGQFGLMGNHSRVRCPSSHCSLPSVSIFSSSHFLRKYEGIFLCREHEHPINLGTLSHAIKDLMPGQERGIMTVSRIEN